jgi:hypothetical protein
MSHHTKDKGDLGVLKVMASLGSQGYLILNPLTEHAPFDIVAYKNKKFERIQVKYKSIKDDCITVGLESSWADKNGSHSLPFASAEIDILAVYCPETDKCYFVNTTNLKSSISLRINLPKNNQVKKVRLAKDFELIRRD